LPGIPLRLVDMSPDPLPAAVLLSATRRGFTGSSGVRWLNTMDDAAYLRQMHGQTMEQLLGAGDTCGALDPARAD
jgi:hypothetical protein